MALRCSLRAEGDAGYLLKLARLAEAYGIDRLWLSEGDQCALPAAALVAGHTQRVGLATGIALAFVRSPLDTARSALQLNEYCNGRFVLGLGTGDKRWIESSYGVPFGPPIARLRECVLLIRNFLEALPRGESFEHKGKYYEVAHSARHAQLAPQLPSPPIHLGALGPKMAQMAGEVADGLLCHVLGSPAWLRDTVWPAVRRGQEIGGRKDAPFEMTATIICAIGEDFARGREQARRSLAFYGLRPSMGAVLEHHGFGAIVAQMRGLSLADAAKLVSDEMVDCFCTVGSPDDARRAVSRFEGLASGVRILPPPHGLGADEDWAYQERIVETFGTAKV